MKPIYTLDFETDPFLFGREPKPFCCGIYDGEKFRHVWGEDVIFATLCLLDTLPAGIVYAHNGGKFDFLFLVKHIEPNPKIINGRIVRAKLGKHELRDSWAILPFGLAAYQKDEIEYSKFEADKRDEFKHEILKYLKGDCIYLYRLVTAFIERFGLKLTVASTAMAELKKLHPTRHESNFHDQSFRPYYFGGRCQAASHGIFRDDWKIFDVNSMYPFVMKNRSHPFGHDYEFCSDINRVHEERPYFARVKCYSRGALPARNRDKSLSFPHGFGEFFATGHELKTGLEIGLISDITEIEMQIAREEINYGEFVKKFYAEKKEGRETKDKTKEIFAKLMLNSAYGKFAANPENYWDYYFDFNSSNIPPGFEPYEDFGWLVIYRKRLAPQFHHYHDVAIAASITGAARAHLMRGIAAAQNVMYCDTDSIICTDFSGDVGDNLGQWKLEGAGDELVVAGKKLYCVSRGGVEIKTAAKGVKINRQQIVDLVKKGEYIYERAAPTYSKSGQARFITRQLKFKETQ